MVEVSSTSVQQKAVEGDQNFHKSVKTIILIANVLGLLPVNGVTSDSVKNLNFRWICPKTVYTFFLISIAFSETVFRVAILFQRGISPRNLLTFIIDCNWLVILISYLHLAKKWPQLIKKWINFEIEMLKTYKYPSNLNATFKRFTGLFMTAATVGYVTLSINRYQPYSHSLMAGFELYLLKSFLALNVKNSTITSILAVISQVLQFIRYFTWIFNSLLVIIVSTAVALRFRQITARLRKYGMQTHSLVFWCGIRVDYIRLCRLCHLINEQISIQVTLALACNFWLTVVNVFCFVSVNQRIKEHPPSYIQVFLEMGQILFIGLYTAWVNDESKRPLEILNSVPSANYNNAIKMFVDHISFDTVALCGYKAFRCTRGLLLTIAGAIVTYELLLIQFTDYILH